MQDLFPITHLKPGDVDMPAQQFPSVSLSRALPHPMPTSTDEYEITVTEINVALKGLSAMYVKAALSYMSITKQFCQPCMLRQHSVT